ncbi:hypothetical protein ACFQ0T_16815 [Kitasatospora gansuensis]
MTAAAVALDHRLARALDAWLPWQRWYAGKGRPHTAVTVVQSTPFSELPDGSVGSILVLRVDFADRGAAEHYQVPVGIRASLPDPVAPYLIAALDDLVVYEATGDHELVTELLGLVAGEHARDPLGFTSFGGFADGPPLSSRPLGVEQTNTSVVVDDRYVVKFFRRLHPGSTRSWNCPGPWPPRRAGTPPPCTERWKDIWTAPRSPTPWCSPSWPARWTAGPWHRTACTGSGPNRGLRYGSSPPRRSRWAGRWPPCTPNWRPASAPVCWAPPNSPDWPPRWPVSSTRAAGWCPNWPCTASIWRPRSPRWPGCPAAPRPSGCTAICTSGNCCAARPAGP